MALPSYGFYAIAFVMAFASMAYELLLAQCAVILYGGTVFRYSTMIGLFIFSLGMGAAQWAWSDRIPSQKTFWRIEVALSVLGLLMPCVVFLADPFLRHFFPQAGFILALVFSVAIGWLAGMELPVLLMLIENQDPLRQQGVSATKNIVGLDFLGTFFATIIVPVVSYPALGIIGTAALAGGLNCVLGWIVGRQDRDVGPLVHGVTLGLMVLSALGFIWRDEVGIWLAGIAY